MCQLIFVNLNNPVLNRVATTLLLLYDSKTMHKDGWGISGTGLYKEMQEPDNQDALGTIVCNYADHNPVMAHVRQASYMFKTVKKVEHNHPFEFNNIIGAHNGTLESKVDLTKKYPDSIDSMQFFGELDEYLTNHSVSMTTALNKTMDKFRGKFAFLIKDKRDNSYYVVRGRTADLHVVSVFMGEEFIGFIVNTELAGLNSCIAELKLIANTLGYADIKFGKVEECDKETVYKLKDNKLANVGTIKEEDRPVAVTVTESYYEKQRKSYYLYTKIETIGDFLTESGMSVVTLDELFDIWYGTPITGMTIVMLEDFIKNVIPILKGRINGKKFHLWKELIKIENSPYSTYKLQFPWFMNEKNEIGSALSLAQQKRRNEKRAINSVL
jgi:predicted glutamine amidotransferase